MEDIRSSGNLKIISNLEIRRSVAKWSSALKELEREEEDWAREFSNEFYPYTYKWISWDDVDKIGSEDDPLFFNSRFEFDPRLMLQQFEFSNVMSIHYWRMRRISSRTTYLLEQTQNVLGLIQSEL